MPFNSKEPAAGGGGDWGGGHHQGSLGRTNSSYNDDNDTSAPYSNESEPKPYSDFLSQQAVHQKPPQMGRRDSPPIANINSNFVTTEGGVYQQQSLMTDITSSPSQRSNVSLSLYRSAYYFPIDLIFYLQCMSVLYRGYYVSKLLLAYQCCFELFELFLLSNKFKNLIE